MARDTSQRRAIVSALQAAGRPLSPKEILEGAQTQVPRLGMATVYRAIKDLIDDGELVAVDLPGEAPRYEAAGKPHHHHFQCRRCSGVYEIHGCPGHLDAMVPEGFTLEKHEVILYGVCATCKAASRRPQPAHS